MRQAYHQHAHSHSQTNLHHASPEMPRSLSHSHSRRSLRQAYEPQDERPHHDQYNNIMPGYKGHPSHSQIQSPVENGSSSSSPDAYMDDSPIQSPYQTINPHYWPGGYEAAQPPAQAQAPPPPPSHGYNAAQDPRRQHRVQLDQHQQQLRQINLQIGQPQTEHYTPDGALRGIAAEDPRLQEHWQVYMSKVNSIPLSSYSILERTDC
jgi:hypothetical protein